MIKDSRFKNQPLSHKLIVSLIEDIIHIAVSMLGFWVVSYSLNLRRSFWQIFLLSLGSITIVGIACTRALNNKK